MSQQDNDANENQDTTAGENTGENQEQLENQDTGAEGDAGQGDGDTSGAEGDTSGAEGDAGQGQGDAGQGDQRRRSPQDRINLAVRRQREAERRAAEAERRLQELTTKQTPAAGDTATHEDVPPDPTKYEYGELDTRYMRDAAKYEARQEFKRLQAGVDKRLAEQRQRDEATSIQRKLLDVKDRGVSKYDDFEEALEEADAAGAQITPVMAQVFAESDVAEDMIYHLAKHPQEAKKIMGLSPIAQARELGRLETKFAKQDTGRKPAAPAPPNNRPRGVGGKFTVGGDTNDFAAFEKLAMGGTKQ